MPTGGVPTPLSPSAQEPAALKIIVYIRDLPCTHMFDVNVNVN